MCHRIHFEESVRQAPLVDKPSRLAWLALSSPQHQGMTCMFHNAVVCALNIWWWMVRAQPVREVRSRAALLQQHKTGWLVGTPGDSHTRIKLRGYVTRPLLMATATTWWSGWL